MPIFQPDGRKSVDVAAHYLKQVIKTGRANYEFMHQKSNGDLLYTQNTVIRLPKPLGHLAVYIFRDITEQVEVKKALEEKNIQLRRYIDSNLQLENFAYVASHDMKEPLRNISSFAHLLHRRYHHLLDDDGKEFINYIVRGVKNMDLLINDLLSYSRVNSSDYQIDIVDKKTILDAIHNHLGEILSDRGAKLTIKHFPDQLRLNKAKYLQVFENLILNAVKFTPPDIQPEIIIDSFQHKGFWHFTVKDNGIGIEPKYHERIFVLFKKLHNKTEYEGTGIGLAICKKVVEKHGGEIWVESEEGEGATFHFTIPV